ncbi:ARM repeat-containing protein [Dacryopinax primogenitus]|uniref:ARM repeat-containing protein n=1 Tax=Dacryopinax primogenitus (strain DJM 731) TaxID=1858805 RepID=M5FTM9_DACPD|nr:ARM repeat-containing protein [Dacryopinax primogenitus]EJT96591.1 ARM repeat-containing protein [Dacryopinax primogenitus]
MDPTFVNGLHALLTTASASSDTTQIKAATATLAQQYYRNPQCVPALFQILLTAPDAGVRQLAGVELRKRIASNHAKLWTETAVEIRNEIKTKILEFALHEPISIVRHTAARVIAAIASCEMREKAWPTLLPWLYEASTAPAASTREVGVFILYSLTDSINEPFSAHVSEVYELFRRTIQDPESMEVRVNTIRALGMLAQFIDAEEKGQVRTFQSIFPQILAVLRDCVATDNSDGAKHGFDVIETLLILDTPLIGKALPELVEFFLTVAVNKEVDESIRVMALNALIYTIKYRKNKIQSLGLAKSILERIMPIGCEDEPDEEEEDNPCRLCFRCIDSLATTFPPSQVFPTLHTLVTQYVSSPDPSQRKCAMVSFGVAIEGCSEYIRPHILSLWPFLDAGLNDQEWRVRKAACIALGCVCEFLGDEAAERHEIFLPAILRLMGEEQTRSTACQALDSYLECLGDHILPYLDELMVRLIGLLETADRQMQSTIIGAIGSAAHAAKARFTPYFPEFMKRIEPCFFLTKEEDLDLRSIAVDTAGTLAEAVGAEAFRPCFEPMMQQAMAGLKLESYRIHECNYLFFIVMSRVFPDLMEPYLAAIVPELMKSCKEAEYKIGSADELEAALLGNGTAEAPLEIKSDEDVDIDLEDAADADVDDILNVSSAQAVEKEIAADAMGQIFANVKLPFLPYVENCLEMLVALLEHYYEGIRKAAVQSLIEFLRTFYVLANYEWTPGQPSAPLHDNVVKIRDVIMEALTDASSSDEEKSSVAVLCSTLGELLTSYGPTVLGTYGEQVANLATSVLDRTHVCQQDTDQETLPEDMLDEDQAEYDSVLTSSAMDLVAGLAHAYAGEFKGAFPKYMTLIATYAGKGHSLADRSAAIGTFGEIIGAMGAAVTEFTEPLFQILYPALADEGVEVRSNAAYALGVLVENSQVDTSSQYVNILRTLQPFFQTPESAAGTTLNARDNACGAVARMLLKNLTAVPPEQVLPTLFAALPLKNDTQENKPVFKCILHIYQANPALLDPYWDLLLKLFQHVLVPAGETEIDDETRTALLALVSHLNQVIPDKVAAAGLAQVQA